MNIYRVVIKPRSWLKDTEERRAVAASIPSVVKLLTKGKYNSTKVIVVELEHENVKVG
jgi:hypothetical protein